MNLPEGVVPAVRRMKDFEDALKTSSEYIIFLETRLSQLKSLVQHAKRNDKKVLVHFDLVQGLKSDEYGMEYVIHTVKPDGIISTRGNIISLAKKHHVLAIQRIFLLDSSALTTNLKILKRSQPDCIEVLPGVAPGVIEMIQQETDLPIIAGGLIREKKDIQAALDTGAIAVSTSEHHLWEV